MDHLTAGQGRGGRGERGGFSYTVLYLVDPTSYSILCTLFCTQYAVILVLTLELRGAADQGLQKGALFLARRSTTTQMSGGQRPGLEAA